MSVNDTTNVICLTREHDKLCILEKYLNNNAQLETLVSNLIDSLIQQECKIACNYYNKLRNEINDVNLFNNIIQLSLSIVKQTPIKTTIDSSCLCSKELTNYLNNPLIF
jgi:hypothetical protein